MHVFLDCLLLAGNVKVMASMAGQSLIRWIRGRCHPTLVSALSQGHTDEFATLLSINAREKHGCAGLGHDLCLRMSRSEVLVMMGGCRFIVDLEVWAFSDREMKPRMTSINAEWCD